jgi:magnesium chelatase family protein
LGNVPTGCTLIRERPFRQPHHTSSYAGIIGGGSNTRPGEITLAHNGVLFMDEFSEFSRNVLEALRQPLESGHISLSRSKGTVTYPADFTLVAASNPCPCGYLGDPFHECRCPVSRIEQYRRKMSGPIMDRIDLHVTVRPVEKQKLARVLETGGNDLKKCFSEKILVKDTVRIAREIQRARFLRERIFTNSRMNNEQISKYSHLSPVALSLLNKAMSGMNFSTRAYFKLIKIARTIADLEKKDEVGLDHMAEAIQYRVNT